MPYSLSDETYNALMRMISGRAGAGGDAACRGGAFRVPMLVRCDSDEPVGGDDMGDTCYPATVLVGDAAEVDPQELIDCWLTILGDDGAPTAPVEGRVYLAILAGRVTLDEDDTRQRAFGVPVSGGDAAGSALLKCRVATTENINLATALDVGDTLNGVTLALNDRVFVWNQTAQEDNGVYVVGSGVASRSTDADTADKLLGSIVTVAEGDEYADSVWLCSADAPITLDTDPLPWKLISLPPDANNGDSLIADDSYPGGAKWSPANAVVSSGGGLVWIGPYTVDYTDVNAAPTDVTTGRWRVDLFNQAPRSCIHGVVIKTSVKFDNPYHDACTVVVGIPGTGIGSDQDRYTGGAGGFSMTTTVSDTNFFPAASNANSALRLNGINNWGSATTISAGFSARIAGSEYTQGSVDFWFLISTPPV